MSHPMPFVHALTSAHTHTRTVLQYINNKRHSEDSVCRSHERATEREREQKFNVEMNEISYTQDANETETN